MSGTFAGAWVSIINMLMVAELASFWVSSGLTYISAFLGFSALLQWREAADWLNINLPIHYAALALGYGALGFGYHAALNLRCFPGLTDTEAELEALSALIEETGLHMIQLRNLNIDPDLYRASLPQGLVEKGRGMRWLRAKLARRFPKLRFGYFNPALGGTA